MRRGVGGGRRVGGSTPSPPPPAPALPPPSAMRRLSGVKRARFRTLLDDRVDRALLAEFLVRPPATPAGRPVELRPALRPRLVDVPRGPLRGAVDAEQGEGLVEVLLAHERVRPESTPRPLEELPQGDAEAAGASRVVAGETQPLADGGEDVVDHLSRVLGRRSGRAPPGGVGLSADEVYEE